MKTTLVLPFTLLLLGITANANATLIGDTVHIAQNFPTFGSENNAQDVVVGSGVELTWPFVMSFDISASAIDIFVEQVSFSDVEDDEFNGPVISNINDSSGNPLVGFSNFSTNSGFSASNIIFGSDFIGFNFDGVNFNNQSLHVDLNFGRGTPVPEPMAWTLAAAGLIGVGLAKRFRAGSK